MFEDEEHKTLSHQNGLSISQWLQYVIQLFDTNLKLDKFTNSASDKQQSWIYFTDFNKN